MRIVLFIFGGIFRFIGALVQRWPLLAIIGFALSPVGPHVRWQAEYRAGYDGYRAYVRCTYVGARGFITPDMVENCPLVAWLDTRRF